MALIAFAVVLGFGVTNWDTARRERNRAGTAVDRIRLELEKDVAGLVTAAPYYAAMSERLDSILVVDGDGVATALTIPGWRGLSPPAIRQATYQAALQTGALEHVDFAVVDQIALSHELLKDFSAAIENALATLIAGNLTRVSEWQRVFSLLSELAVIARDQTQATIDLLPSS